MPHDTVMRFLDAGGSDLVVQQGTTTVLDPDDEQAPGLHRVEVHGFDDLQALRLVPARLTEEAARAAMAADDRQALELAHRLVGAAGPMCGCRDPEREGHNEAPAQAGYVRDLDRTYRRVRRSTHDHLADTVSEATGAAALSNSLAATTVHWWVTMMVTPFWLLLYTLGDVEIMSNAQLILAKKAKGLYGANLKIHTNGKLIIKGSGVTIRFLSAQGDLP